MSKDVQKQRQGLNSNDSWMSETIKTALTNVLKGVGSKLVKNDRLLPLLEKKSQLNEMKTTLQRFDQAQQYSILIEYLFTFA